jgi:nitrate/TMAO reductase-like tetraheme cytochrome c subunit
VRVRLTKRLLIVVTIVTTAIVVALGLALAGTSSASFCASCHNMKATVAAYERSPHKSVNCEQCHTKPGPFFFLTAKMEALQEPVSQLTGHYEQPILGSVLNTSCRRCHTDKQLFATISKNGIRVNHKHLIQAGYQCVRCHSTVAHGDAVPAGSRTFPTMDQCLVCHNNQYKAADGTVAESRCDLCHTQRNYTDKPASHNADWLKTHGSNGILSTCSACHRAADACTKCHNGVAMPHTSGWLTQHGKVKEKLGEKACSLCHDTKTYCLTCHQVPMPHPSNFIAVHNVAAAKSDQTCFNCHEVANCQACHVAHSTGTPQAHGLFKTPASTPSPSPSQGV